MSLFAVAVSAAVSGHLSGFRPEAPPGDEFARGAWLHYVHHLRRAVRVCRREREDHRPLVRVVRGRYPR